MAGIGFELQKVLKGGGIASLFKVALAGIVIVAGPWLISIVGIFFLNRFAGFALTEASELFMAAIVYSYAFSLSLFGGIHYIFTRYISDLIYLRKEGRAVATLLLTMVLFIIMTAILSSVAVYFIKTKSISSLLLYKVSAVFLFIVINLIWLAIPPPLRTFCSSNPIPAIIHPITFDIVFCRWRKDHSYYRADAVFPGFSSSVPPPPEDCLSHSLHSGPAFPHL